MEFDKVLNKIIGQFEEKNIRYALIGGFALGLWGVVRATADLDFLINKEDSQTVKIIMKTQGYNSFHESENVLQFSSENKFLGSIDFLYSFRKPSLEMLNRTVEKKILEGKISIKVLIPEDLIGLKVQSIVNNPGRKAMDSNDIEQLITKNSDTIGWNIIKKHFLIFNLENEYQKLKQKHK